MNKLNVLEKELNFHLEEKTKYWNLIKKFFNNLSVVEHDFSCNIELSRFYLHKIEINFNLKNENYFWSSSIFDFSISVNEENEIIFEYSNSSGGKKSDVNQIDCLKSFRDMLDHAILIYENVKKNNTEFLNLIDLLVSENNKIELIKVEISNIKNKIRINKRESEVEKILSLFEKPSTTFIDSFFESFFDKNKKFGSITLTSFCIDDGFNNITFFKNEIVFENYSRLSITMNNKRISKKHLHDFIFNKTLLYKKDFFESITELFPEVDFKFKKVEKTISYSKSIEDFYKKTLLRTGIKNF